MVLVVALVLPVLLVVGALVLLGVVCRRPSGRGRHRPPSCVDLDRLQEIARQSDGDMRGIEAADRASGIARTVGRLNRGPFGGAR